MRNEPWARGERARFKSGQEVLFKPLPVWGSFFILTKWMACASEDTQQRVNRDPVSSFRTRGSS